ncbi:MAG TPA: glycosyltransferase [Aliidongia sp.]|uniref:glycosyltransferase n=1 Tax=Aliidongia sp. TaxID=1914230 RepID=UPI002DDCC1C8|nr:glycosyltransferase [Aliidongia sp.]HEV2677817.1 glycosyltransferase [Aliidongia sp.]
MADQAQFDTVRQALARRDFDEALRRLGDPSQDVEALALAGLAWTGLRQFDRAAACYGAALRLAPDRFDLMSNLGSVLVDLDRFGEALALFQQARAVAPRNARVIANLANLLDFAGALDDALVAHAAARALDPADGEIARNQAMTLLRAGRLAEGWPLFEHRRRAVDPTEATVPRLPPLAGAPSLMGRRILLFHEQGFGDTLQMLRYVPLLAASGATLVLRIPPPLSRLAAGMAGVAAVIDIDEAPGPLDYQAPLMSLPLLFATTLDDIPATPYLRADPVDAAPWGERLAGLPHPRVGLVWAGSPEGGLDHRRSMPFADLAPLFAVPAGFVSLQIGPAAADWAPPDGAAALNAAPWLHDFADTAALLSRLDLLITVDTSAAHLGGALGRPVWMISRFSACWRWLTLRGDSPWYPTLRVLRQPYPGRWEPPIAEAARWLAGGAV